MKKIAVEKAERNLISCETDYKNLLRAKKQINEQISSAAITREFHISYQPIFDAWESFVGNANSLFSKLEQGSKSHDKSKNWYDTIKHLRRSDELLNYVKQARNCEVHTLEPLMQSTGLSATIPPMGSAVFNKTDNDNFSIRNTGNGDIKVNFGGCIVTKVYNRGKWYEPPTSHMGKTISTQSPQVIMELFLQTAKNKLVEAKQLPQQ